VAARLLAVRRNNSKGEFKVKNLMMNLWREESGQDLIEYSLLLAFVALAASAILTSVSTSLTTIWQNGSTAVANAATKSAS
jgi:Flp pilus assembly pilin Flp